MSNLPRAEKQNSGGKFTLVIWIRGESLLDKVCEGCGGLAGLPFRHLFLQESKSLSYYGAYMRDSYESVSIGVFCSQFL
ncbi:hypothetical protein R1flu_013926 [Riccia fluitans]|uniref:Uncharacterized protein n=1 Tax=Riccia fluitans TaxID=41844 RepID=A0ABD1YEY7_9MARC